MKYCNGCKETLSLDAFAKCTRNKSGVQSKCKKCRKALNADWYDRNSEHVKAYSKDKYINNIDYYKNYAKEYSENNRDYVNTKSKEWSKLNRDKRNAVQKAYRNEYPGVVANMNLTVRLVKSNGKPTNCEVCGDEPKQLNGHHDDYAKPNEIRWLCPLCHATWHAENGEGLNKHLLRRYKV
jgi:arsenate reductase-like glutaredoxin family protein